jgi:hypothetical protein
MSSADRQALPVVGLPGQQKVPNGQQEFSPYLISRMETAADACFCGVFSIERDPGGTRRELTLVLFHKTTRPLPASKVGNGRDTGA